MKANSASFGGGTVVLLLTLLLTGCDVCTGNTISSDYCELSACDVMDKMRVELAHAQEVDDRSAEGGSKEELLETRLDQLERRLKSVEQPVWFMVEGPLGWDQCNVGPCRCRPETLSLSCWRQGLDALPANQPVPKDIRALGSASAGSLKSTPGRIASHHTVEYDTFQSSTMYESDSNLEPSSVSLDHRAPNASRVKLRPHKHLVPDDYLAMLDLNNNNQSPDPRPPRGYGQTRPGGGAETYFHVAAGQPSAQNQDNVPLGTRILGGFIIPPFFSLARNISKAQQEPSQNQTTVANFFGNLLSKITSPNRAQDDVAVVNIEHEIDVVTGTRPSMWEERMKTQAFLDSYLGDCLRKESSIYTPEEKIQMKKIQEILVREKEEERAMEKEKEEKERERRERKRRSKGRKGVGKKEAKMEGQGCGDEEEPSTTLATCLSREHPLFARAFREKVRIYTPSGTEVSVDSNGGVSIVDDVRDTKALRAILEENERTRRKLRRRRSRSEAAPRAMERHRRHRVDDGDVDADRVRKVMQENRQMLQRMQVDQAKEIELSKMIIEENRRTLRRLKMEKTKEKLRRSANKDTGRKVDKTCCVTGSTINDRSKTRTDVVVSESVIRQGSDSKTTATTTRNECLEENSSERPAKMKACSMHVLSKKRKAERRRETESRTDSVGSEIKEEPSTRRKEKIVEDVKTRRKETKPEVKNLKTTTQEKKRPNTQRVKSEFDEDSKSDDVQVVFHNKHFLEGKSGSRNSPKPITQVNTDCSEVGRKVEEPDDGMSNDLQPRCAPSLSREYVERDTENEVKRWIQNNLATGQSFTVSVDHFVTSSRETVGVLPKEEVVTEIPISRDLTTRHGYRYADQGDNTDYIEVEEKNPRGIKQSTKTRTCRRETCSPSESRRRQGHHYGDVRPLDDVTCGKKKGRERDRSPSSNDEGKYDYARPPSYDFPPRRHCINRRRHDLTSSQESMEDVVKLRNNAFRARRLYRTNRREETKHRDAGRRARGSMAMTPICERQSEEYRQTYEQVQNQIREWKQAFKDGEHVTREMSDANKSHNSLMALLKAISKEDISSRDLETLTDHELGFGAKKATFSPGVCSRVPKGKRAGLVVARPKPSFHRRIRAKDVRMKTKEKKAKDNVTIPESRFAKQETIQEDLCLPIQNVSLELALIPMMEVVISEEPEKKVVDPTKIADETKEDQRTEILEMLKKVQAKAEKLGKIRKLMEVMEERGDIDEANKKSDLLADMLLALNTNDEDESEHAKHVIVVKAVEPKHEEHDSKVVEHRLTSSKTPDECLQPVVAVEPVPATPHRKRDKHSKRSSNKHVEFSELVRVNIPPSPTEHKTDDRKEKQPKTQRDEKSLVDATKESDVNVVHTVQTHTQNASSHEVKPSVDDVLALVPKKKKKKQHGGACHSHRGKRSSHEVRVEQRSDDEDASNVRSKHPTKEGGDVSRLDRLKVRERKLEVQNLDERVVELNASEETVERDAAKQTEEIATDRVLARREHDDITTAGRYDYSRTRQEDVGEVTTSGNVVTSCFNNIRSKQMEEHMAKVLAEYLAKKHEFQQFIEHEELMKRRQMKCKDRQGNDYSTESLDGFGDVVGEMQANAEGGCQGRDVIRISKEVDIQRHVTTCCRAHSVCCRDVESVAGGLQLILHSDDTKCGRGVGDFTQSARTRREESEQVLQQDATTCRTGVGCRVLPSVLTDEENIMSLSHKYVKPLEFESGKPKTCRNRKCDDVNPATFSKRDNCREDYVIKTCDEDDVSKQARSPPTDNRVEDDPSVISLMEPGGHFQLSTNEINENNETTKNEAFNDYFKPEKPTVVLQSSVVIPQQASALNEEGREPQQRLAGGCEGDHSRTTVELTKRLECVQQLGVDVNPTSERWTGLVPNDVNLTSSERETRQHGSGNTIVGEFTREAEHVVEINSEDIIQCRRDVTCTHGDSTRVVSCIDTPDKAMEEIFKKMDDVIINRFLTLASINGITIVVTPRLVVNENAQAGNDEFKDDSTEEKLQEITKEELECEEVENKEKEGTQEGVVNVGEGSGTNKEVVYKIVSVNNKSEMFSPEVYKNEPEITIGHRPECVIPGERGSCGRASDKTLMDRIDTVIGNQERMQQLALRNSHRLETASCHFKKSDVYFINHVLCKSTGAIRREKKVQTRLRRSKTTKTRSKPWRVGRVKEPTRHGDPAAERRPVASEQQPVVAAETSADLRLLEEIALVNVPDTATAHASKERQRTNFDRCYEQVLRCLPVETEVGIKGADEKVPAKVPSKVSSGGGKTNKGDDRIPVDSFLENVRNNLEADELQMLEQASRTTVMIPAERRSHTSKHVSVIFCSKTYDESNSTSTVAANIKTIEEIIAEADNGDKLLGICECFGVDNITDLMDRLTSSDDVVALAGKTESPSSSRYGRRERRRGGGHLKARHKERQPTHRRKERRRREQENETEVREIPSRSTNSDENSKGRRDEKTTTSTENSTPSPDESFESKEVWRHRRLSKVIDIDEWIRDGAVATRGFTQQEENFVFPLKPKRSKIPPTDDPIEDACTPLSKFVLNYALKSGIILGGGVVATLDADTDDADDDADVLNVKIELGDNKETLIVIQVPEEDDYKVASRRSLKCAAAVTATPPHSSAQIVHVDSEEIVLSTDTPEALSAWTRAEQEAFRDALKRHPPTPRVWDRIAKSVGRSKRDCVLHFMRIWRRLEGAGGRAEQQ